MIIRERYTATVIGAGNLAYSLIPALQKNDVVVKNVVTRDAVKGEMFNSQYNVPVKMLEKSLATDTHLVFLTISDDHIVETLNNLIINDSQVVIHTSGSSPITILKNHAKHYGVFYPLQTFTMGQLIEFARIPVCVEGSDVETLNILQDVAGMITSKVKILSAKQRKQLHLAAVFVSNFTNHMYDIGEWLMEKEKLDFSLLYPLIEETTDKIKRMKPHEAQTGPAKRGNKQTLDEHRKILKSESELALLYEIISNSISEFK